MKQLIIKWIVTLKFIFILLFIILCNKVIAQTDVIKTDQNPTRWTITTKSATYQIMLTEDNSLTPTYFGPLADDRSIDVDRKRINSQIGTLLREVPYRGGFVEMTPVLEVIFADHNRELELVYDGHEIGEMAGYPFIRFDMRDTYYPLRISETIRIIPELDIIEKWLTLKNLGSDDILIERAYSGSVLLPKGVYDLIHLSGDQLREFFPRRTQLTSGRKSLFIRTMKGSQHAPFFIVRPENESDENNGAVWFGHLARSGNWQIDFEVNRMERTQIAGGINFWDTHWVLKANTKFETPKIIFGVALDGSNGASRRLHRYILDQIMSKPYNQQVNKILYNSWYATTFDVNEEDQVSLARIAKDAGVELFVMDDGWFKGRTDDHAGLGDWFVDPKKFPNGLGSMIQKINALGMDFGIWVEPEMVNPNSDLYRTHPDWVLRSPHRTAHESRNQLILNFARDDVRNFTIGWLDELLSNNNIKFIKWDMNRHASEVGWPDVSFEKQRELRIRYIDNLYSILTILRERHPDVVFESCSSGGGRADIGILQFTDQFWTSDNTDPGDRLLIQYGCSYAYPAKAMVNWVTDHEWHNKTTSLKFRFHVAMAGNLGVGNDLHKWSNEDKAIGKEMIALYKSIRHIIQFGDQYRLISPFENNQSAIQFVTRDGHESVIFTYQTLEKVSMARKPLVLHGLDTDGVYVLHNDIERMEISGRVLMTSGITIPLKGNYASKVIVLKKIN